MQGHIFQTDKYGSSCSSAASFLRYGLQLRLHALNNIIATNNANTTGRSAPKETSV